ncbi:uncharacterized protein METZ01_LOCUS222164, partial [marine metagenome]
MRVWIDIFENAIWYVIAVLSAKKLRKGF